MSRKKTPEERRLTGYHRPSRHGPKVTQLFPPKPQSEPEALSLPRDPPVYLQLTEAQAVHWRSVAKSARWLSASDAFLVALWCVETTLFETAMAGKNRAQAEGDPAAAAAYGKLVSQAGALTLKLAKVLGFTPASRDRLGVG